METKTKLEKQLLLDGYEYLKPIHIKKLKKEIIGLQKSLECLNMRDFILIPSSPGSSVYKIFYHKIDF